MINDLEHTSFSKINSLVAWYIFKHGTSYGLKTATPPHVSDRLFSYCRNGGTQATSVCRQSLGLVFYPYLKCLKRLTVLLPDAAVWVSYMTSKKPRAGDAVAIATVSSEPRNHRDVHAVTFCNRG
jgi:hypothetical protein